MSFSFAKKRKMRDNVNYLFQFTLGQVSDLPRFVKVNSNSAIDLDYVAVELQDGKKNKKVRRKKKKKKKGESLVGCTRHCACLYDVCLSILMCRQVLIDP